MKALLYLNLLPTAITTYGQPVLVWAKKNFPEVATLDLDANSDDMLQHYALRLLQEAEQVAVCIRSEADATDFRKLMPLVEELLQPNAGRLLLLSGNNARLLRMLQARPQLTYKVVEADAQLQEALQGYLGAG
ncbi:hypothetical protein FVR03_23100 [Pontibacter qinzhouensis]|uniref:Uncharacterized protein n=1 Tax=Pontibacter qinzhouensis TaxID=2603253 RepID=A0A5C8ILE0_9BACT|nr:hypothetical protein [Pontibacter qinzhouensis]TXK22050.1 hypothetical protein FVR03_23100 [Pontibacter qinzhouensis]